MKEPLWLLRLRRRCRDNQKKNERPERGKREEGGESTTGDKLFDISAAASRVAKKENY